MTLSHLRALRKYNPPCDARRFDWPLVAFWAAYAALIVLAVAICTT